MGRAKDKPKDEPSEQEQTHELWLQCVESGNSAICHLCQPPRFFPTLDECLSHSRVHAYGSGEAA
jgi:hypothetical protein